MKNALGVSIALVAVLWTWLVLAGPLNGLALVWAGFIAWGAYFTCLLYTSPSPRDGLLSRMPSSA